MPAHKENNMNTNNSTKNDRFFCHFLTQAQAV